MSITATCIKAFWNIKRAYGQVGSHPNYEHRLIEEDKITDLESTVRAAFKELYKTDDLFRSGYFGELSRIWRQLDEAECKEYELNCISKLENIPYFLEDCKGSWTSGGAHGPIFFNENFEGYISTESLYEKVCLLKGSDIYNQLTDTLKNTVVAFYLWYTVFASSEYIISKSHCSICGKSMQIPSCPHIRGHLYYGEIATELIDEIQELQAVCLVSHPEDKRCVIEISDDTRSEEDKFVKLVKFLDLHLPPLQRFSVQSIVETRKREDIAKVGRNQPCSCGSGLKFKKCCGQHLYYQHKKIL